MFNFFVEVNYLFLTRPFEFSGEIQAKSAESALEYVKSCLLISPIVVTSAMAECI